MPFNTSLLVAQSIPPGSSFLGWMINSLSNTSSLLIAVTAVGLFFGACFLVSTKRTRSTLACYLVLLPIPFLISICGWISGSINSLATIASTPNLTITSQDIAGGLAASLVSVLFSILVSLPTYMLLAYGLIARDFKTPSQGASSTIPVSKTPSPSSIGANVIPTH